MLLNASVVPGIAVVSAVLILSSGASRSQIIRWVATAGAAALVVCSWWLVPFLAGSSRLVRYHVPLSGSLDLRWRMAVGRIGGLGSGRRLGLSTWLAVFLSVWALPRVWRWWPPYLADLFGYLRAERWLELPILVAVVAIAAATSPEPRHGSERLMRPSFSVVVALVVVLMVPTVGRWEFLPLAVWALWGLRPRIWAWGGVLAWSLVLLWIPFWSLIRNPPQPPPDSSSIMESVTAESGPDAEGTVYIDRWYTTTAGDVATCTWVHPWATTARSEGRIRTLQGLYRETSVAAEFTDAETALRQGHWLSGTRPHWDDAWRAGDSNCHSTAPRPPTPSGLAGTWNATQTTPSPCSKGPISEPRAQRSSPIQTKTHGTKPRLSGGWRWPQNPPRCELAVCLKYRCCGPALQTKAQPRNLIGQPKA